MNRVFVWDISARINSVEFGCKFKLNHAAIKLAGSDLTKNARPSIMFAVTSGWQRQGETAPPTTEPTRIS